MFLGEYRPEGSVLATPANREYLMGETGLERAMNEGMMSEIPDKIDEKAKEGPVDVTLEEIKKKDEKDS